VSAACPSAREREVDSIGLEITDFSFQFIAESLGVHSSGRHIPQLRNER
jgi:hypothetical protein